MTNYMFPRKSTDFLKLLFSIIHMLSGAVIALET